MIHFSREVGIIQAIRLHNFELFNNITEDDEKQLAQYGKIIRKHYLRCEIIKGEGIGLVLTGKVIVQSTDEDHPVLLRVLSAGECFGAAGLYADKNELSKIYAKTEANIAFVPGESIDKLIGSSESFRKDYLMFLANRISFLNRKICFITAGTVDKKLFSALLSMSGAATFNLPLSMTALAELLDISRASLYRAFDILIEKGLIKKNNNEITISERL